MHPNDDLLNAYADGSLDATERADVERHLATCAACRQVVDEVSEILRATKTLEHRDPPARAWSRIERAVRLEREHAQPSSDGARAFLASGSRSEGPAKAGRYVRWAPWLAAAAALVLATAVGIRYMPRGGVTTSDGQPQTGASMAAADSARVEAELREAEAHYENAIKGLERIANAEQNELDPATAATLRKNLSVIDQAISESRAAVRSQPSNEPAQQSLMENFKTKIGLLQDTVALINEMRKGNEAGAARIVSGLKQKGA
jgi:anti-sigma factor RsiW